MPLRHTKNLPANLLVGVMSRGATDKSVAFTGRSDAELSEDREMARLVTAFQAGDREAFADIYSHYFDRVYGYLRVLLKKSHDAEDAAQQVFTQALEALPRYQQRGKPFSAWLFTIVRNYALQQLQRDHPIELMEPAELDRRRDRAISDDLGLRALEWIKDNDLMIFIQRLPLTQRQILALRYMMGLTTAEIAKVLDRKPATVRRSQSRALAFLRERLDAIGRTSSFSRHDQANALTYVQQARVLRARRFQLQDKGPRQ
jgi:RNA polymerase sigma-70 factor (ECF subfamily)